MKGLLIRVGIDLSYGGWNAPYREDGSFCYIPMQPIVPEVFEDSFQTNYDEFEKAFNLYVEDCELTFPGWLHKTPCHLDPDFNYLTYGDTGQRASRILNYFEGSEENFIAFYSSFQQIDKKRETLMYALIGLYKFQTVSIANEIPENIRKQNAHTRLRGYTQRNDIVIFADNNTSGRLKLLIPIGEYRNHAYRVRRDLLQEWGDISNNDGYIQRSAYPPHFCKPDRFLKWFNNQNPVLAAQNNIKY